VTSDVSGPATAEPASSELAARLRVTIGRLQRQIRRRAVGGLTLSQVSALVSVEQYGPLRAGDLAVRESVSAPTMTRILTVVEERGLVERRVDPTDRRASSIALTRAGAAERLERLGAGERRRLADALVVLEQIVALPEE
jgi:DNA-binding MarR family transcriptional regulator